MTRLIDFLAKLDAHSIFYSLSAPTQRAIMVTVVVPGERWEVEFFEDHNVAVEAFRSSGAISGPEKLDELFERFSD